MYIYHRFNLGFKVTSMSEDIPKITQVSQKISALKVVDYGIGEEGNLLIDLRTEARSKSTEITADLDKIFSATIKEEKGKIQLESLNASIPITNNGQNIGKVEIESKPGDTRIKVSLNANALKG